MSDALIGVIVGGAIGLLGSLFAAGLTARRERQKAEALVRAYLIGILEITEAREHVKLARHVIACWRAGDDIPFEFFGNDTLKNDLVEVGELAKQTTYLNRDDAANTARFITLLQAVRINMNMLSSDKFKALPIDRRLAHVEWALNQWLRAVEIASRLIDRL
jgi:hypothetical protein